VQQVIYFDTHDWAGT